MGKTMSDPQPTDPTAKIHALAAKMVSCPRLSDEVHRYKRMLLGDPDPCPECNGTGEVPRFPTLREEEDRHRFCIGISCTVQLRSADCHGLGYRVPSPEWRRSGCWRRYLLGVGLRAWQEWLLKGLHMWKRSICRMNGRKMH